MKHELRIMEKKKRHPAFFMRNSLFTIRNSGAGFTLIELLISISIIGVLSTLVMVNTGFGSRQKNLERAAQRLALDIRTAQNLALAPSDNPNCVYGLHVQSSTQYTLYRNQDCLISYEYNQNSSTINTVTLGNNIVISPLLPSDISFEAPEPITYLGGTKNNPDVQGIPGNTVMTITLLSPDNTTKKVITNRFGQVEIQ